MKRWKWDLNKSQRMQLKALACVLGLLLLLILLLGRLLFSPGEKEKPEIHIPVVTNLENVWVMEVLEDALLVFSEGEELRFPYGYPGGGENAPEGEAAPLYVPQKDCREQVADITLTDGFVTQVQVKKDKINGKVLSVDASGVELEGRGRLAFAEGYKGYRLYDSLSMCGHSDVVIGYSFADFVIENGEVCAILLAKEETMEYIRVLLKTGNYDGRFHESLTFRGDTDFCVRYGSYDNPAEELHRAGESCTIDKNSAYFQGGRVSIVPAVLTGKISLENVSRSQGEPSYRGTIELSLTEEGIVAVNEVLLEEYLYSVVPSEMPASYPEEALKAQAICARTYAYSHMLKAAYPQYGAHVDDSAGYQVYNNILEQGSATTAVKETYGQLLYTGSGELAGAYYYSTSCGLGSDAGVWKSGSTEGLDYLKPRSISRGAMEKVLAAYKSGEMPAASVSDDLDLAGQAMKDEETFAEYIRTKSTDDFEVTEGWYRWTYEVDKIDGQHIMEAMQKRYDANAKLILTRDGSGEFVSRPVTEFGTLKNLYVSSRGSGGVAEELILETDKHTFKVVTEHNIRAVLNDGTAKIKRQDGSEIASPTLLPSAFFVLEAGKEKENVVGYTLTGGGYGHGVGMSQNGARSMAKDGYLAEEILSFFYDGCRVEAVYGEEQAVEQ